MRLKEGKGLHVDVTEFRRLDEAAKSAGKAIIESEKSLSPAAAMVRDSLLAGLSLKDGPAFEDPQSEQGESLRREQSWVLERLVDLRESREKYRDALEPCRT